MQNVIPHVIFLGLLYSLLKLLLAGPFAMEPMRQVAESLLRSHCPSGLVDVFQLHFRFVSFLLAELHGPAGNISFSLPCVLVVRFSVSRQNVNKS